MAAVPTALTATEDPDAGAVYLGATVATGAGTVEWQRSENGGLTWNTLRNSSPITSGASSTIDYEAPTRGVIQWRARSLESGAYSDYSDPVSLELVGGRFWLRDPRSPALNVPLNVDRDQVKRTRVRPQTERVILGASRHRVARGKVQGYRIELPSVFVRGNAAYDAIEQLLIAPRTLQLATGNGRTYWVAAVGDMADAEAADAQWGINTEYELTLVFLEVAPV